ncbi:MAG: glycosyltransferase [Candidatus Binatia bacterium]
MSGRRLKVLQVGKFFPPHRGGIETYLQSLSGELRRTVDVEVLVANTAPRTVREVVNGVSVTRTASIGRARSTSLTPLLARELRHRTVDVVHLHTPNPVAELAVLRDLRRRSAKLVVTWHSDVVRQRWLGRLHRPLSRRLLARADAICVATPQHVTTSALLPAFADKCHVCPYGVDPGALRADPVAANVVRRRYGARPIVLGVGRLVYYKGFEVLLDAAARLDATVLVVGEGELRPRLEARIGALGLEGRAWLVGDQPDLRPYFAAADVFVLPSTHRSEAFGIVQLEAMAFGKPVVSTRLGTGVEHVNVDGATGLTVAPGDPVALRSAIARLLDDPALRLRLGANGRRRVEEEFTTLRAAADVLAVYRRVTGPEIHLVAAEGWTRDVA